MVSARPVATLREHSLFQGSAVLGGVYHVTGDVDPHAHDFVEVAVLGTGHGTHVTSRGEHALQRGDIVILRPGAWHAFTGCEDLTVANCCISAHALRGELALLMEIPMFRQLLWTEPTATDSRGVATISISPEAAEQAIAEIVHLQNDTESGGIRPGRALSRLVTVLGTLADGRDDELPLHTSRSHPAVIAAVAALESSPAHPWQLDELARTANLDPSYLGRLFRQHLGLTPLGHLARVRAEHAASLLAESWLTVARVGAAVGWDDPTYFARRFRELVGLTPTQYRQRIRNDSLPKTPVARTARSHDVRAS